MWFHLTASLGFVQKFAQRAVFVLLVEQALIAIRRLFERPGQVFRVQGFCCQNVYKSQYKVKGICSSASGCQFVFSNRSSGLVMTQCQTMEKVLFFRDFWNALESRVRPNIMNRWRVFSFFALVFIRYKLLQILNTYLYIH